MFMLRMHIRRDEYGIWMLSTGGYQVPEIPHPTWRDAWNHAEFIWKIRLDILA